MSFDYWSQWDRSEILSMLDVLSESDLALDIDRDEKPIENIEDCDWKDNRYTYRFIDDW